MLFAALFPHLAGLDLHGVRQTSNTVIVDVGLRATEARCPACTQPSRHVHSRYTRRVADQPVGGHAVRMRFHVRRFRCRNPVCARATFVEQQPALVVRSGRRSVPLQRQLEDVGLSLGGRPGQRFAARGTITVSRMTLLRLVRRLPEPVIASPQVLGIDDFALKRGHCYGTILVDLEAHRVIDLLPERTADGVAAWLRDHGRPKFICRDRGGDYAAGARLGAPDAIQVADRFHVLQNSSQALERVLLRYPAALRASVGAETGALGLVTMPEMTTGTGAVEASGSDASTADPRRARRLARYDEVVALARAGSSVTASSEALGLSRPTVRKYLRAGSFPEWPARRTLLSAGSGYASHLQGRWAEGCQDAHLLWDELRAMGFPGSVRMVQRAVARWREGPALRGRAAHRRPPSTPATRPRLRPPSPRQAAWLLLKPERELTAEQRAMRAKLLAAAPDVEQALAVMETFRRLIRERDRAALEPWFRQAAETQIPELRAFAANLRRDRPALEAALTYPWSSGQVEGQVTKTKLIKRQMFGRAKFDLLKKRVLLAA